MDVVREISDKNAVIHVNEMNSKHIMIKRFRNF